MQLSIIIVSYNVKFFLEQCLASVLDAIEHFEAEVWVVDNASSDYTIDFLKSKFPWVKFIENRKNVGFSKANNQALKECFGKYVLFLNPDTLIAEDTLVRCISLLEADRQAGALGVRMIDGSATFLPESKRSFPSPLTSLYKLAGLASLFPSSSVFSRYSLGYLDQNKNYEVDVLSGAFMLVKKDILIKLKGFDEAFFMYGEDIDLSYRIQKMGYKNYYFGESTIIHFKGKSTLKKDLRYIKMFYQAMYIFVRKHYNGKSAYLFTLGIWLRASVAAASQIAVKTRVKFIELISNFLRDKKLKKKSEKEQMRIIAGTEEEFAEVKNLLDQSSFKQKITGRIAIDDKRENALGDITILNKLIQDMNITEVIFCRGKLSYSEIMEIIQKLPKKVSLRFHAKGTESIVGSDSKNTNGEYIVVK